MKNMSSGLLVAILSMLTLLLSACQPAQPACPPESVTYLHEGGSLPLNGVEENPSKSGQQVEINGKQVLVDQVVQGALCDDSWAGTVYVPCQVQVFAWQEEPLFLENCDLNIAPGTVVYVAAHNDKPYYQGCSCHTGEIE